MSRPNSILERFVLVDTSAFYAALDRRDQWHRVAVEGFRWLADQRRPICTTNLVLAEVYALLTTRLGSATALQWLNSVLTARIIYQGGQHL